MTDPDKLTPAERDALIEELSLAVSVKHWSPDAWQNATYTPFSLYSVSPDDLENLHTLWSLLSDKYRDIAYAEKGIDRDNRQDCAYELTRSEREQYEQYRREQDERDAKSELWSPDPQKFGWSKKRQELDWLFTFVIEEPAIQKATAEVISLMGWQSIVDEYAHDEHKALEKYQHKSWEGLFLGVIEAGALVKQVKEWQLKDPDQKETEQKSFDFLRQIVDGLRETHGKE